MKRNLSATMTSLRRALATFAAERRGVAAVEFAFIVPIMVAFYILTMEFSQAIETSKKLERVAIQIGDLITQLPDVSSTELDSIMKISEASLQPYTRSAPEIRVAAIQIGSGASPQATVLWSRYYYNGLGRPDTMLKPGGTVQLPPKLMKPGMFLVRTEANLRYAPIVAWSDAAKEVFHLKPLDDVTQLSEVYYQHPRQGSKLDCNGC